MENYLNNDNLCPCGSGRKYMNCCKNKKGLPRQHRIEAQLEDRPILGVQIRIDNDGVKLLDQDGKEIKINQANIVGVRERENKNEKVLFNIPNIKTNSFNDPAAALCEYDVIYAIDTNTEVINGISISMTAIASSVKTSTQESETTFNGSFQVIKWESTGVEKPEKVGWVNVIENIKRHEENTNTYPKIALIVDSDLGNLPEYNQRTLPLIKDYYLPENMVMIYASADTGMEYIQNKLIRECDKRAKLCLEDSKKKKSK